MAQINISTGNGKIIATQNTNKGSSTVIATGNEIVIHNDLEVIRLSDGTCSNCKTNNYVLYEDKNGIRYLKCIKCKKEWTEPIK
jgi:hypothetical protein